MTTILRSRTTLRTRLRPLHVTAFLQGVGFWVPVEKLFMNEIGFDAATIAMMAALYAAVVPLLEIPSGILADRWSRRGILMVSSLALAVSAFFGGIATDVPTYALSALALGVYFALYSGTMDSLVYDTLLEETGDSTGFEREMGRNRLVSSASLVLSALGGGLIAQLADTRVTYFLTVPFAALSILTMVRFREPRLHRNTDGTSLRAHIALTYRTLVQRGRLLPIVIMSILTALLVQAIVEFGPLWLVALAAPAALYGPYWAGVMSSFGLGGTLAGKIDLDRPRTAVVVAALLVLAGTTLTLSSDLVVVAAAQILLALLVVAAGIHVSRLLHDAVPSSIRAGVASGTSTFTWIAFLPFALAFGFVSENHGVHSAGWMITALTVLAGGMLVRSALVRGRNS